MKFGFVAKHRGIWPVDVQCEALGVSRSGFYAWCARPQSVRARTDAAILQTIRTSFAASDSTYGARRMLDEVRAAGHVCGRSRVARLMLAAALLARPQRRAKPFDTGERAAHLIAANVLDRDFTATVPIRNGWRTSRLSGRTKAGCTSRSYWTCSHAASSAGQCSRR